MKGVVIKSTGSWYLVRDADGNLHPCRLRGKFKLKDAKVSNPLAVGDRVMFEREASEENTAIINHIEPRQNYIIRKSTHKTAHSHIIAANLDQALLVVTLVSPRTSFGFIDRFLVTAEAYDIPVTIIYNKIDLYDEEDRRYQEAISGLYSQIGYPGISCSAEKEIGLEAVQAVMQDKTSLVSGHSGVGKSTLINKLVPDLALKTSEISDYSDKGKHTTTFAEMFEVNPNSFIIDTPGIKELGLVDIENNELGHFFPEIRDRMNDCKYYNCRHLNEPGCAVIPAVKAGQIALTRYESYRSILAEEDNRR
ncbi:ribosome small subunit-dependent GTPase A [Adhaeribacter rhizoryzae]|uniref:Small ribosomal subunit biogenesis GTPase RsgA n=2 Tax=Adhaeribacter rhizoryzae TaxID=2607907 RepID=A0A5M6CVJ3_9BACT|nr:ribosome small subunit-dependent GTPase A [Adhaeribacter rhizoryzae]